MAMSVMSVMLVVVWLAQLLPGHRKKDSFLIYGNEHGDYLERAGFPLAPATKIWRLGLDVELHGVEVVQRAAEVV
jgi:hypothetical protein